MPPKKKAGAKGPSSKKVSETKKKIVEDKTFGLKNKVSSNGIDSRMAYWLIFAPLVEQVEKGAKLCEAGRKTDGRQGKEAIGAPSFPFPARIWKARRMRNPMKTGRRGGGKKERKIRTYQKGTFL
jgi:hypothetical protein